MHGNLEQSSADTVHAIMEAPPKHLDLDALSADTVEKVWNRGRSPRNPVLPRTTKQELVEWL